MKSKLIGRSILAGLLIGVSALGSAQLMYGNTFPFWNVTGPLDVGGATTLRGATTLSGGTTITGGASVTGGYTVNGGFTSNNGSTLNGGAVVASGIGVSGNSTFGGGTYTFASGIGISGGGVSVVGGTVTDTLSVTGATTTAGATTAASAGKVGETLDSTLLAASAVAGGNTTVASNITTLTLTPGDWEVGATCVYAVSGITATEYQCGISAASDVAATFPPVSGVGAGALSITPVSTSGLTATHTQVVRTVPVLTTVSLPLYVVSKHTFSAGSYTAYGTIHARRVH